MRFYYPNKPVRTYDPHKTAQSMDNGWVVQGKLNGKRVMISVEDNHVSLMSREGRSWPVGKWWWLSSLPIPQPWFADGELLHKEFGIVLWDLAVIGGETVYNTEYYPRLQRLQEWIPEAKNGLSVVQTLPASEFVKLIALKNTNPHLEGFVFKRKNAKDLWGPNSTSDVGSQIKYRW